MGDSTTHPIKSMLLTHTTSGPPVPWLAILPTSKREESISMFSEGFHWSGMRKYCCDVLRRYVSQNIVAITGTLWLYR